MEIRDLRVRALRRLIGDMQLKDFANAHDLDPSYLSQILNGHRSMGEKAAANMADKIGVDRQLLVNPASDPAPSSHANVAPTLQPHRQAREYPLISWVAAGSWAESCDNYEPGHGDELIASDENAGECGYWLEIKGKSMSDPSPNAAATFPPRYRILVQPEGFDVISGKFYVARLRVPGGWETTFKQYVRDAGVEYLQPLNPTYDAMKIDENVEIIGRVIDARPPKSVF